MNDRILLPGVDNGAAIPVARQVLPPLVRRIEDHDGDLADTALLALTDAFVEGIRFAMSEFAAQLIEAGVNVDMPLRIPASDWPED
jgi:hypothetical protein